MSLSFGLASFIQVRPPQIRVLSRRSPICSHSNSPQFERRSANYQSTIWHDNFIQSLNTGDSSPSSKKINSGDEHESRNRNINRVSELKAEVSQMLYKEESLRDKLELVDAMQQLGVAYHFKEEINCVITKTHESITDQSLLSSMDDELYVASLVFRLLRMHGFNVQEDIFKKYLDKNGDCQGKLSSNTCKGILSLYEASHLAKEGEETLEMARQFTTKQLKLFLESSESNESRLKEHVAHALELPLHWRMERLHSRWFIDQYRKDEQMRAALWELAVLDFNLIQNTYREELKQVSRWWTALRLHEKLPFIRDRLVENYLISVGLAFEPEHASYRIAQTKANCFVTTIDDIYDVYGSLDELEIFTDAIEQWDITATEGLPDNIRMCFLALVETVEDQGYEVFKERGLHVVPYLKRAWTDLCKAFLVEARWYHNGYSPTLEQYLKNAWISSSGDIILSKAYCINDYVTAKDLEQFSSGYLHNIVRYSSMNLRLYNDLATSSDELERGDVDKSIQCYMRDKIVTESVARQEIKDLIWKYWTLLNGEIVSNSAFEKFFRNVAFSVLRTALCFYQHGDGYGKPSETKNELITSVLLEPIQF